MSCRDGDDEVGSPASTSQLPAAELSKNALKKQLRRQKYEAEKPIKRQLEKDRRKARRDEARAAGTYMPSGKRHKKPPADQQPVNATLLVDCGFDALMHDKEITSMTAQLSLLYSSNRFARRPFASVVFCGQGTLDPRTLLPDYAEAPLSGAHELTLFDSRLGQRMEHKLGATWRKWDSITLRNTGGLLASVDDGSQALADALEGVALSDDDTAARQPRPVLSSASSDKIVYLTADTDTDLARIEEGHTYVIGGLVDRNRYKLICADKARRLGLKTARLPIGADRLRSSAVMTVNIVVQILLAFNETQDWAAALHQHLPLRKRRVAEEDGELEDEDSSSSSSSDSQDGEA